MTHTLTTFTFGSPTVCIWQTILKISTKLKKIEVPLSTCTEEKKIDQFKKKKKKEREKKKNSVMIFWCYGILKLFSKKKKKLQEFFFPSPCSHDPSVRGTQAKKKVTYGVTILKKVLCSVCAWKKKLGSLEEQSLLAACKLRALENAKYYGFSSAGLAGGLCKKKKFQLGHKMGLSKLYKKKKKSNLTFLKPSPLLPPLLPLFCVNEYMRWKKKTDWVFFFVLPPPPPPLGLSVTRNWRTALVVIPS